MPNEEKLDEKEAVRRLNAALALQYRSALQYSLAASSLTGIEAQALGSKLTEFGDAELADVRRLVEKIVSFGGEPTTEVAELRFERGADAALGWIVECEEAAVEALGEAIEPTGREGRSEALEHLMEHLILRKQTQVDFLNRAIS
ncbi:MAG TPA: ferritin-like domain-containing protein [Solirubrobacterales bacterium]|nr:ferritin-like domain-containing protein [Solirubrobacterales bacterium]